MNGPETVSPGLPDDTLLPNDTLLPRDTRRALPIALLRARETLMARFRPILAARDMTEQQWRVIRVLGRKARSTPARSPSAPACWLRASPASSRRLEERALIIARARPGDGRRLSLAITAGRHAMIREVTPETQAVYAELEEQLRPRPHRASARHPQRARELK